MEVSLRPRFLGILLIIFGTIAIIYDVAATLLSVFYFGWLLIIVGASEAVQLNATREATLRRGLKGREFV